MLTQSRELGGFIEDINRGDYFVLPILADWYEDHGNEAESRAIRWIIKERKHPCDQRNEDMRQNKSTPFAWVFTWYNAGATGVKDYPDCQLKWQVPEELYQELKPTASTKGVHPVDINSYVYRDYNTPWEALSDLIRVLVEQEKLYKEIVKLAAAILTEEES